MRTLLDDDEIESGQISVDDAAAHRLALALTRLQTTLIFKNHYFSFKKFCQRLCFKIFNVNFWKSQIDNFWTNLSGPIAGLALLEEESDSAVGEHTLLHREALLVVAATDAHHVALNCSTFSLASFKISCSLFYSISHFETLFSSKKDD